MLFELLTPRLYSPTARKQNEDLNEFLFIGNGWQRLTQVGLEPSLENSSTFLYTHIEDL